MTKIFDYLNIFVTPWFSGSTISIQTVSDWWHVVVFLQFDMKYHQSWLILSITYIRQACSSHCNLDSWIGGRQCYLSYIAEWFDINILMEWRNWFTNNILLMTCPLSIVQVCFLLLMFEMFKPMFSCNVDVKCVVQASFKLISPISVVSSSSTVSWVVQVFNLLIFVVFKPAWVCSTSHLCPRSCFTCNKGSECQHLT